uniref:CPG4 domain-containing protein n=1 Tax=Steinernema glaseri TaxID=37863 RepID=A0A1I8AH88_9BILA
MTTFKIAAVLLLLCVMSMEARRDHDQDYKKIYCIRTCFSKLITSSPFKADDVPEQFCSSVPNLSNCLYKCDKSLVGETSIADLKKQCFTKKRRVNKYSRCLGRHMTRVFGRCADTCEYDLRHAPKENSIYGDIADSCRMIQCRLPCTITELNKRCPIVGNHLFGTYSVPFDAMAALIKKNATVRRALVGMPEECRFLFDMDEMDEDFEEDFGNRLVDWEDWERPRGFACAGC